MNNKVAASAKSLTSLAFERLHEGILTGQLAPGERLRIRSLSESYDIGATAIREALSRLVSDGLVDSEDQRGFSVSPVSRDELIDLTHIRIDVECLALAHAIERGGVDWESNLLGSFHRLSKTPMPTSPEHHAAWAVAHRQYQEALVGGCGSPWLIRLCRLLYDRTERYRNLAERQTAPQAREAIREHKEMMEAAIARDAGLAKRLLAEHFWETTDIVLKAVFSDRLDPSPRTRTDARKDGG
jgi:GntR family transcriptional regulator, carbon starvation induced regulator